MSPHTSEEENEVPSYYDAPSLIAKERQLTTTLRALEAMLKKVQDLRTKVNFERTQLITLIQMSVGGEREMNIPELAATSSQETNNDNPPVDPLLILDRLYNGEFSISEEEEDDEDDDDVGFGGHDNFGAENVEW